MGKLKKVTPFVVGMVNSFRDDCSFSLCLATARLCSTVFGRMGFGIPFNWSITEKHKHIEKVLKRKLRLLLEQFADNKNSGVPRENAPIWVCWWSGEEMAPPLVKKCITSIRVNAGTHPVHLISRDNYKEYIDIPEYIYEKFKNKSICTAHLSDYLRFALLSEYGGLWLDATIFCTAPIPEYCFQLPVFTCKGGNSSATFISDYRWTTFCFGGFPKTVLFQYICRALEIYWQETDIAVDYLLLDYLIDLAYKNVEQVRLDLDRVPENNIHRDVLAVSMREAISDEYFEQVIKEDTVLYKLSWREEYSLKNKEGKRTIYALFAEDRG